MRTDGINKIRAKTTKIVVDKNNIDTLFVRLDNARDIRAGQVNRLLRVLEAGEHFETPIVTYLKNEKHRLLDGNHRHEAMKKYLEKHNERKIEVWIFYYDKLSEIEEKEYYTKWNCGLKQSTNDFVKQYWDDIPIAKAFKKNNFPWGVSHVWSTKDIEFKTLIGAYLTKKDKNFAGGYQGSAISFIEDSKKLGKDDYPYIAEFMKFYISVFGNPDRKNIHYKQSVFTALMRIWLDNLKTVSLDSMRNGFIRIRNHERVIYYEKLGGTRENTIRCRNDLLEVLNAKYTKNKPFV